MGEQNTREAQYLRLIELDESKGRTRLGLMVNQAWNDDPRRLTFTFSRYKFVSKMLAGRERVLEVGCGDAFGTRIVQQEAGEVTAIDFDPAFVDDVNARQDPDWPIDCRLHDMMEAPIEEDFDGAFSLDVLEHIPAVDEDVFLSNISKSLVPTGVLVIGTPSEHSQPWASAQSKTGHVNCKTGPELSETLSRHFDAVFLFSMNDEVVHTGFQPMAQYFMAVCAGKRV